jgi:peptide/nickel transport system permease protein
MDEAEVMAGRGFVASFVASPKAMAGLLLVLAILAAALLSSLLAPFDPQLQSLADRLLPPFSQAGDGSFHLLGTDQLGRDLLSRLVYGARVSLLVGLGATRLAGLVGVLLGLAAGYLGGWVDDLVTRLADVQLALPYILLAIAMLAILGGSLVNIILVLSLAQWVTYTRVVRSGVLSIREREYVLAARALGIAPVMIMLRHILPNVLAPVIVIATFAVAQSIVAEAGLSFLGLGVPPSVPSWGGMLADARSYLVIAWWLAAIPGLAITVTVIGVNLLGDWLRDRFDPRLGV